MEAEGCDCLQGFQLCHFLRGGSRLAWIVTYLVKFHDQQLNGVVYDSFDARTALPQCASVPGRIRDSCSQGSCWAFSITEDFNDKRCVATSDNTLMSVEDTTADCGETLDVELHHQLQGLL